MIFPKSRPHFPKSRPNNVAPLRSKIDYGLPNEADDSRRAEIRSFAMKLAMATTALMIGSASLVAAVPTDSRAQDVPPSAFAPQSQSDQPSGRTAPSRGARVTAQQTGSASGEQAAVPLAQRVDPIVSNQPISGAANK